MTSKTSESTLLPGRATRQGTERFASRQNAEPDHFARPDELSLSSIALGTLRGEPGGIDDLLYRSVVDDFVEASGNVFNTALSDRMQTSERALGQAIARLVREQAATRDELIIVTKGGALTPDPDRATSYTAVQRDLYETYIDSQLVDPSEVIRGHSMAPRFLLDQIERSRRNLGLETLDYYLIQEPEIWLRQLGPDGFRAALRRPSWRWRRRFREVGSRPTEFPPGTGCCSPIPTEAISRSSISSRSRSTSVRLIIISARFSCPTASPWAKERCSPASSGPTAIAVRFSTACVTRGP